MAGPLSYIGGKNRLAKRVIEIFPEHVTYVEAFAGGAQVFFRKNPSKVEVLNDLDGEIVNFYRVCQQHYEELLRYFKFVVVSRTWFDLLKRSDPSTLTDVQRAARYLYLLRNCFASLVRNPVYHRNVVQPPSFNLENLPKLIDNAHKRLTLPTTKSFADLIGQRRFSTWTRHIGEGTCIATISAKLILQCSPDSSSKSEESSFSL